MKRLMLTTAVVLTLGYAADTHAQTGSTYSIEGTHPANPTYGTVSQVYAQKSWVNTVRGWFGMAPMTTNVPMFSGRIGIPSTDVKKWLEYEKMRTDQRPGSWKSYSGTINDGGARPGGSCDSKC